MERRRSQPQAVVAEMRVLFETRPRDEWFELLGKKDLAIGKVYTVDETPNDPQLRHREMFVEVNGEGNLKATQVGIPTKLSDTPGRVRSCGSPAGQDTSSILAEINRSPAEIEALIENGAAYQFRG